MIERGKKDRKSFIGKRVMKKWEDGSGEEKESKKRREKSGRNERREG